MADAPLVALEVEGLPKLLDDLKAVQKRIGTQDRLANRAVSVAFTTWARSDATAGTRQQAHFAAALRPSATQTAARVLINGAPKTETAGALGTFFGSKRYRQFPAWVGNSWIPGARGQGPQPLNDTAADHLDQIGEMYAAARMKAWSAAFPEGGES